MDISLNDTLGAHFPVPGVEAYDVNHFDKHTSVH